MKKKSWLTRYFRNYLLIGLVPVILLALAFGYMALTSYKAEIQNSHYASFSQFVGSLENLIGKVELVARHLSDSGLNPDRLRYGEEGYLEQEAAAAVQKLATYEDQMVWEVPVVLFVRGTPYMYTSAGVTTYADFQRTMSVHGNLDFSGFFTALSSATRPTIRRLVREVRQGRTWGDAMALMYPVPAMEAVPEATLCFLVDESVIAGMLDNCVSGLKGSLYLFSGIYQEVLSLKQADAPDTAAQAARLLGTGILNHGDQVVMRSVLQNGGISVSFVCASDLFYKRLDAVWMGFGIVALGVLLLSVIGAVVLTRRSYTPLRRLMHGIGAQEGEEMQDNEFDLIQNHVDSVAQRNSELGQQLARQRPMVTEACLMKILLGKIASQTEMALQLRCAGIDLSGRGTFALLISAQGGTAAAADLCLDRLRAALCAPLSGGAQAYAMEGDVDGLFAAMVVCPPSGEGNDDPREALTQMILDRAQAQPPIWLTAGIGSLCREPMRLHDSCMEAMAVVREFLPGTQAAFACYDQVIQSPQQRAFPTLDYALLNQSLKQADAQMARKALDKVMGDIRRTDSVLYVQCMCYDVINNMLRTMQALQPQLTTQQVRALCAFHTPEEFHAGALDLIDDFCSKYGAARESRSSKMREELISYVATHVFNYDFSLEQVADSFSLSQSYLSRFYKQETGYTFTQYITLLRLDKAKRLLIETSLPLKDIVVQVGYIDTASFVRKFKACEGVTPGQWRETYKT